VIVLPVHHPDDKGYKQLLTNKQTFLELLQTFVGEDWVQEIANHDSGSDGTAQRIGQHIGQYDAGTIPAGDSMAEKCQWAQIAGTSASRG
jgi:hypothetical protein